MEVEFSNEPPRSREEEDELGRSAKKFKESRGASSLFLLELLSAIKIVW